MLSPEQISALHDISGQLMDPIVEFLIRDIARRISEAGQLTGTAAYQTWRLQKLGVSQKQLKKELQKRLKVSQNQVQQLMTQAAETGYDFDISRLPTVEAIPFEENTSLQQIVNASVQLAQDDLTNITQTIGFVTPTGKAMGLTEAYQKTCDFAFMKVTTGAQDYISAVREATRALAEKGIQVIDYESGVHTSLEAAVRRNIMGALGLMQEQISQQNHDDLGCDGWEISAHAGSAPDHEPIQGKQYRDAAYTRLNNSLHRRIGTLNCGHSAMPIIFGVNDPQYTDEELEEFRRQNEEGVTVDGKHYTLYEATQRQRSLERSIRKRKHHILVDEELGDAEKLQQDQIQLQILKQRYHEFSKAANLPEQYERMEKAGFTWKHGMAATATYKQSQPAKANTENGDKIDWPARGENISNEQYKALRIYAESKGVFLRGFKNSDVDISLATEAVDTATHMLEKYPELQGSAKRPFTLDLDRYMRSVDFAEVKEGAPHILHLNADAFRNRAALQAEYTKLADEGWFVKGTTYKSIIYHEMGHMVSDVYGIDGISVMQEVLGVEYEAEVLDWCKNNLSQYSAKLSGEEIIAEAFSAFFGLKNPPQEIVDFVQKCDKIIKKGVPK